MISDADFRYWLVAANPDYPTMQLYRRLKAVANMTPNEFIRLVRLESAARFLEQTDLSVSEIFYKTGFNNQSYFFREFKKVYGCSPNEYRSSRNISVNR